MRIRTQCRACGLPFRSTLERSQRELRCPNCDHCWALDLGAWSTREASRIDACLLCGSDHLYGQKDVNRAAGCLVVAIGAVFVPWTYGLSLILLSLVDLVLYLRLPLAVVCYRCDTVFRDARPNARQGEFDLLKHDVLKYGKSWQELEDE